jgi:hypothetical protein
MQMSGQTDKHAYIHTYKLDGIDPTTIPIVEQSRITAWDFDHLMTSLLVNRPTMIAEFQRVWPFGFLFDFLVFDFFLLYMYPMNYRYSLAVGNNNYGTIVST